MFLSSNDRHCLAGSFGFNFKPDDLIISKKTKDPELVNEGIDRWFRNYKNKGQRQGLR
jgi:hypothetical protein